MTTPALHQPDRPSLLPVEPDALVGMFSDLVWALNRGQIDEAERVFALLSRHGFPIPWRPVNAAGLPLDDPGIDPEPGRVTWLLRLSRAIDSGDHEALKEAAEALRTLHGLTVGIDPALLKGGGQ